ncbi:MAG TPA: UDP-N-acetylmuramoyl-L-alanyl-D-glutamate--2,6-diaminopimelate ligase [Kiritimatiellia bacterium]|nr:UDP-N-acetylmuramoyl-L-alanyl-D-glutamate--2,6-diaminopimelate ligase [Kiritimatiellia bacterium]HRU69446.1 UDP-N-acetylmuramoyl-L-alanyl-D-glutamate--2,6-diaminopimelate ligase [Kiritimatiellia bacterium]
MNLMEIRELLPFLKGKPPALAFSGVQCDSRRIRPGDLFVALSGSRDDGARYAAAALAKGAVAVLAQAPLREVPSKQMVVVNDARGALAGLAAAVNGYPSRALRVYGVTGTNGKTTTVWLLRELLHAAGHTPGLLSTVQVEYGGRTIPATRTTPDACELQGLLAAMRSTGCDSAVMEVSSHALDQQRTACLCFEAAAFTNLSQDHLDYHGTMEAYFQTKQRLFAQLAQDHPGAAAVCCLDEGPGYGARMAAYIATLPLRLVTCGFPPGADLRAEAVSVTPDGSRFTLVTPDGARRELCVHLAGRYNIANMLCAAGLALDAGVPLDTVAATLEQARPQWGRLERVRTDWPAAVFVDYAHTDDALRNVLTTLREITRGRLTVVFGCGGNRDRTKRPLMGRVCAELADRLVVTSDNPRGEEPMAIINQILEGVPAGTAMAVEPDRRAAIRLVLAEAGPDDVVLVAGKGHEPFQELADRTVPFDDRQVVAEEASQLAAAHRQSR